MTHVVSLSTLYPNPTDPRFGPFVARSLEALAAREGWQVSVINPIGVPPLALGRYRALARLPAHALENGIEVYRPRFTLIPRLGARINAHRIAHAVRALLRHIDEQRPIDLLDAQFFFPDGPAAAWLAQQFDLPLSIKARGSDITYWGQREFAREQMLEAAQRADGLLAVSRDLAEKMVEMGMSADKITVHYTGLDQTRFRPLAHDGLRAQLSARLSLPLPHRQPLLVCVGALIKRKGQDLAIGALPHVPEAHLLLVGKGEDEAHLRRLARDLGVEGHVHFAGSLDHDILPLVLSAADAMVLPSANEGLANAWVEALACGTPVVTCDVGGARELIEEPLCGALVERDVEAIAAALRDILEHPRDRHEIASSVAHLSWEANAEALARHYQRLIAARR